MMLPQSTAVTVSDAPAAMGSVRDSSSRRRGDPYPPLKRHLQGDVSYKIAGTEMDPSQNREAQEDPRIDGHRTPGGAVVRFGTRNRAIPRKAKALLAGLDDEPDEILADADEALLD